MLKNKIWFKYLQNVKRYKVQSIEHFKDSVICTVEIKSLKEHSVQILMREAENEWKKGFNTSFIELWFFIQAHSAWKWNFDSKKGFFITYSWICNQFVSPSVNRITIQQLPLCVWRRRKMRKTMKVFFICDVRFSTKWRRKFNACCKRNDEILWRLDTF